MKHLKSFESYIDTKNLEDIDLVLDLPSVGSKKYETEIKDGNVIVLSEEFIPFKKYDFVVTTDGKLLIGLAHYKLSDKSKKIKSAGELIINDKGKITYMNNQSGHYEPTHKDLKSIVDLFEQMNLTQQELKVQYLY